MRYCCLILTRNEERTIAAIISGLRRIFETQGLGDLEIVLSDDSTDRTGEIARGLGARVVPGGGAGLGRAYLLGVRACADRSPDRIFVIDGDGQTNLSEIPSLVSEMDSTGADMVVGSRFLAGDSIEYKYPIVNRLGVRMLSTYLSWATRQKFTDSHGGLRLLNLALARTQEIRGVHTYVQESIVDAVGRGFRIREVPARWQPREHGQSRVVHSVAKYAMRTSPWLLYRLLWISVVRKSS